jgi:hypothetical protein
VSNALQYYLRRGAEYVLQRITYLPILPIAAEEKGLKTRFPTACLTAANLVQQILRRALDHIMVQDPRFSQALGGHKDIDLSRERGPWYSQDATAATDLHAQWLTQTIYEEVVRVYPVLSKYTKWFNKLFGTKKLLPGISQDDVAPHGLLRNYPRSPLLDDTKLESVYNVSALEAGHATLILKFTDQWIDDLNSLPGVLTTTGQMMGDPTSFPPLMLHTLYCAQKTIEALPYRKYERVRRHKDLRKGEVVLKGVGDDAQKPRWSAARRRMYDEKFIALGGRLSYDKCFHHPSRSIIAEVVYEHGRPVPTFSTSILVAPPGGSKGQVTWSSQSLAIAGDPDRPRLRFSKFLWRSSPYYYTWRLADRLGIPISVPGTYGGVGVPLVPHRSLTDHIPWLQFLSQQSIPDLVGGIGLSIGQPSSKTFLDVSARQWLDEVIRDSANLAKYDLSFLSRDVTSPEAELRLSVSDAYRSILGQVRAAEFYFRGPPLEDLSAPSVRVAVQKFQRKVRKARVTPIRGYAPTIRNLEEKSSLYFSRPAGYLALPGVPRKVASYGMEQSGEVRVRWKAPHVRGWG